VTPQYVAGDPVSSGVISLAGVSVTATASCTTGSIVGGGHELTGGLVSLDVSVDVSRATSATTWTVTATSHAASVGSFTVRAFAICA
jgi:hypothetical protein